MEPKLAPITYILGTGRSGTTLLRVMLAGHPQLWSPPEMLLGQFSTMAEREAHMAKRYWEKGGLRRGLMDLQKLSVDEAKDAAQHVQFNLTQKGTDFLGYGALKSLLSAIGTSSFGSHETPHLATGVLCVQSDAERAHPAALPTDCSIPACLHPCMPLS